MENIQGSISSPLVVLDHEMRVIRYNANATSIFHLTANDIGTPITKVSCQCEIPNFEESILESMRYGKAVEVICETAKQVFQMRVHPSRDDDKKIIGAVIVFFDNTEFIHAQDRLKSSDKRIRAIMDSSPTHISLKDNVGRYLMANDAFLKFHGLTESDLVGKTDRELFPESFANEIRDNDLEVLLKRKPTEKNEQFELNGKAYVILSNRFPLFNQNERNPYAVGTVSLDITEQVHAQDELQKSETRYRAMVEDQAVFILRHKPDGQFTFTNSVFCSFFGGTQSSNLSRSFFSIVDRVDQDRVKSELKKITSDHPVIQYEHRTTSHGTLVRWIKWIHRGIFDEKNHLIEYQAVGFDVTEIHNQTTELLAKENLYTHVLEHTSDYLSVYRYQNGDFILETFNQSSQKNQGMSFPRLNGKSLRDLVDLEQKTDVVEKYEKAVATQTLQSFEETIDGPGGAMTLSTTIVPIKDPVNDVLRIVALSRDITRLKRTEQALRVEKINAEAANQAKSDFLASMSHELRTPLNVIMGMSQLLSRGDIAPQQLKLVESIQRSSKVLLALIEDVLDLSKIEAGKITFESRPLNLGHIVDDVVQSFETAAEQKGIVLEKNISVSESKRFLGDEVRLKQILINLMGNAVKFTERGFVRISVFLQSSTDNIATLGFEVQDSGVGIPQESFKKIFKRFSQADSGTTRKFGGTGLGLSISKQLVELMHGEIGFSSEVNKGSLFWFKIQLPSIDHEDIPAAKEISQTGDFAGLKILAVDDIPESLKVLEYWFGSQNCDFALASSGQEAIDLVESETFDLILMDMQMPGMDGLEATRRIRSLPTRKSLVPIVALTANATPEDREKCLRSGMNDFLTKPIEFDELKKAIKKYVKGKV